MFLEAVEQKQKQLGMEQNVVKELFEGKMHCYIDCKFVDCKTTREEIFTDVQLIIKQNPNIYLALNSLLKSEELCGENAYQTDTFGKQDAIKGQLFKALPPVLTF